MMLKAHQWLKQNSLLMVYFAKIYVQVGFVYYIFNDSHLSHNLGVLCTCVKLTCDNVLLTSWNINLKNLWENYGE